MNENILINKENGLPAYFFPMLISSRKGVSDSKKEFTLKWKKFDALTEKSRKILISRKVPYFIKKISDDFNFTPQQTEEISRLVRDVFFGNIKQENITSELAQKIGINEKQAQDIAREIKNKIFLLSPQENYLPEKNTAIIKLPILEALKKYPELGRQRISANNIKLKIFPDPVKPSIKNWIADYRQVMGTGNYGAIEKSNYLFHNENAKRLNSQELQKLSLVLKSMDSRIPLTINAKEQRVIFPPLEAGNEAVRSKHYAASKRESRVRVSGSTRLAAENNRPIMPNSQTFSQPNKNDTGSFRFSSPQTLESEKEKKEKLNKNKDRNSRYYQIYPMGVSHNGEKEKSKPKVKGNVVNLREDF